MAGLPSKRGALFFFWYFGIFREVPVRFGSVRLRFGGGTVQAVPVFGSGGSSAKRGFCVSVKFDRKGRFWFQFRFLENGSCGSALSFFGVFVSLVFSCWEFFLVFLSVCCSFLQGL